MGDNDETYNVGTNDKNTSMRTLTRIQKLNFINKKQVFYSNPTDNKNNLM